jgi:hypothetical protein
MTHQPPTEPLELAWTLHQLLVDLTQLQILANDLNYTRTANAANRLICEAQLTYDQLTATREN